MSYNLVCTTFANGGLKWDEKILTKSRKQAYNKNSTKAKLRYKSGGKTHEQGLFVYPWAGKAGTA